MIFISFCSIAYSISIIIARAGHSSLLLSGGTILLVGGTIEVTPWYTNDVWKSTNSGATWSPVSTNAGWQGKVTTQVLSPTRNTHWRKSLLFSLHANKSFVLRYMLISHLSFSLLPSLSRSLALIIMKL